MEIAEVEVIPVAHREPPLRNSWGAHSEIAARTVLKITTRDGLVGISETYGDEKVIRSLERAGTTVEGTNPYKRREIELRLQDPMAYSAIDTALLDLIGKETGQPVSEVLGGRVRDSVEFSGYLFYKYANSDFDSAAIAPEEIDSPESMVAGAREFVDRHGFTTLKLKGGVLEPEEEIETLRRLAEEFGRDTPLRIDPNGTWSVETATRLAKELRETPLNLQFLEDPVPTMNAHSRLKRNIDYPIATNMYVTSFKEIAPSVRMDAVDIILSDHHYWSGMTGNVRLDDIANTFDLGIGMHSNSHLGVSMAAMTHVAAAMPNLGYACDSHYPWMADDIIEDAPIEFNDGKIDVPDEPGLGVTLDGDAVERLNRTYEESDPLAYSTVESMATAYADGETEVGRSDWLPNKPRW